MILFQVATGDLHCFGPNHGGPTHVFGSPSDGVATISVMACSVTLVCFVMAWFTMASDSWSVCFRKQPLPVNIMPSLSKVRLTYLDLSVSAVSVPGVMSESVKIRHLSCQVHLISRLLSLRLQKSVVFSNQFGALIL